MDVRKKIIEKLKEKPIGNISEALKFLEEKEGAEEITEVNWRWEVRFQNGDIFKFHSDKELIDWCKEQKNTYFNEG